MGLLSNIEHSVENGLSSFGHHVVDDCVAIEHGVVNSARVGEVLLEGAWDYTKQHPGEVAKTLAIAAGVGVASALLTPVLPAVAVVGVCTGLGALGTAALAINTADSVKDCWSDIEIVWDADHHSKSEVAAAKKSVEAHTGEAVTNLALLPVTFYVGNAAGNAAVSAFAGGEAAAAATAATATTEAAAIASSSSASAAASASSEAAAATTAGCAVPAATGEVLPCPNFWTRVENNPIYNFFSSPYVAENDVKTLVSGLGRMMSTEATTTVRHQS